MTTNEELKKKIEKHGKWLRDEAGGEMANLGVADLRVADLRGADLSGTGCLPMQVDIWPVWITPEACRIGCQLHPHEFWLSATPESVAPLHGYASEFWGKWGEVIKSACVACANHGWPVKGSEAKHDH